MLLKELQAVGLKSERYLYNARNSWYPIKPQGKGFVFAETPKLQLNEDSA